MLAEIGEAHAFELFEDAIGEGLVVFEGERVLGINRWDVREDLDVVAAFGCFARIGAGRGDEIDGRVVGELAFFEDGVEVLRLVLRVEEIVVGELWVNAIGAEVDDEAGAGGFEAFELLEEAG